MTAERTIGNLESVPIRKVWADEARNFTPDWPRTRIARPGRGKSSGARVVFLFAGEDVPVFLLTVFGKNEKASLSTRERTALISTSKQIVENYRKRK